MTVHPFVALKLLGLLGLVACGSSTEPAILPASVSTTEISSQLPPSRLSLLTDTIRLTGGIEVNERCYAFSANALMSGQIVVTLIAQRRTGHCLQQVVRYAYDIRIAGVPAGSYRLRLDHSFRANFSVTETILEQSVAIP